ncbi:hypothetical protein C3Y98_00890 [Methylotenera oryzisoli]|uniref:Uncharacterized protein n=1 Tax=Methylotenera oryzisoli TaxID=2080758 RepID=A0A4Y9VUD6_9PROT|nr:hypothetical protein [Methylotenera oryzisoli]TFW72948.1 hypothetical protein C3Y98_00890 [Methylotenera oryzisoli]
MLKLVLVVVAAIVIGAGFFGVYVIYDNYSLNQDGKERSFILFILGMLFSIFLGNTLMLNLALNFICTNNSGAGCSFGVSAMTLPFSIALSIAIFLFFWASLGCRVKKS